MDTKEALVDTPPALTLKGGHFTLTAIQLLNTDIEAFSNALKDKIIQAPKFFNHAPIVLDVQSLIPSVQAELDIRAIHQRMQELKLVLVGVRGAHPELKDKIIKNGLALLSDTRHETRDQTNKPQSRIQIIEQAKQKIAAQNQQSQKPDPQPEPQAVPISYSSSTKVVTSPVRSGQQIYAAGGDLLVLAPVSHGAELLADGHIHVMGPLRGRALAGIGGDTSAMIFCKSLEAELVSIAGQYKISEDLKNNLWKQAVRISLDDGHLTTSPF